jgi:tetratricopeptide (TPR) repeat protein
VLFVSAVVVTTYWLCIDIARGNLFGATIDLLLNLFGLWLFGGYVVNVISIQYIGYLIGRKDFIKADRVALNLTKLFNVLPVYNSGQLCSAYSLLGLTSMFLGKIDQAEYASRQSLRDIETSKSLIESPVAVICLNNLAWHRIRIGDLESGKELADRAFAVSAKYKNGGDAITAFPLFTLALADTKIGEWKLAEQRLRRALSLLEPVKPTPYINKRGLEYNLISCEMTLSVVCFELDNLSEGKELAQKLTDRIAEDELVLTPWHIQTGVELCLTLIAHNEFLVAETLLGYLYALGQNLPGHPDNSKLLDCYGDLLRITHREAETEDMRKWLRSSPQKLIS